jgi:hypothetical protein
MRTHLLVLALAAALLAVLAPAAQGRPTIGISENNPQMFSDPLFRALKVKTTRVVVSYNVVRKNDDELARVQDYLARAAAAKIKPLVSFEHARGDATVCNRARNRRLPQCRLPTPRQYRSHIRAFLRMFPDVRTISPWNEANHFTQGTSRSPAAAGRFARIVKQLCRRCRIVAVDVLDQADNPAAARPKFNSTLRWIRKFKRSYRTRGQICGLHNYSDTNRFRSLGTRTIIRALGCRQIWLTETGGLYRFASFAADEDRQTRATQYMFRLVGRTRKVKRVYVYTWFGAVTERFDAGIVARGQPRRVYQFLKELLT